MDDDGSLEGPREIRHVLIVCHLSKSIVHPEIFEVLGYLLVKRVWQRLVISEPREKGHPVVQIKVMLLISKVQIES